MLQKTPATVRTEIKIMNAAVAVQGDDLVVRGVIDPECLDGLKTDDYQREVLSPIGGKRNGLVKAIEDGVQLPDVELGMRGKNVKFIGTGDRAIAVLRDPVYIVDGLQRISAMRQFIERNPDKPLTSYIGATIHLNTDKKLEKERFHSLNQKRIPVGPSVILRNLRDDHPAILTLYGLSMNDPEFALFHRVTWEQRMKKTEILTGLMLVKATASLHRHCSQKGGASIGSLRQVPTVLDRIVKAIGLATFRANTKEFFDIIDACWGVRNIEYNTVSPQIRGNWLMVLGRLLSDHTNFWNGKELFVDADQKRKLKSFPLRDSDVMHLAGSGTMAIPILYNMLVEHMNKGRRINRLKSRRVTATEDESN